MKPIELALSTTDGYVNSITRKINNEKWWWEIEIGIPKSWVFDDNDKITCEVIFENKSGKLIKVMPKTNDVVIDDLIRFTEVIITTNEEISKKEKQFTDRMQEMKNVLEQEAQKFYLELDELKENSFKNKNKTFRETFEEEIKGVSDDDPKEDSNDERPNDEPKEESKNISKDEQSKCKSKGDSNDEPKKKFRKNS